MRSFAVAFFLVLFGVPAAAQPAASPPAGTAQAYFEFMMALRLEAEGDPVGALAALERAQGLDPDSAEILAERAGLHARQNQGAEARAAAERALTLDPDNVGAHRILALVYSAWSEGSGPPPAGETPASMRAKAIDHLKTIRTSPEMATDLSLQIAYGRLLLRDGQADEAATALEGVATQAPYLAEPFVLLAETRTSQGRMFEAAEALARAAEINPRYYVSLGDLYERLGRWAAAAGAYGQAVEGVRSPSRDLRLRHVTALLNVPGGEGARRAKDVIDALLKATPDDTRVLYLQSTAYRQLQDAGSAEDTARKILAIDPTSVAGLNALARALSDQYQYGRMVELLTPLSKDLAARARGQESEAASALAQLGLAHQQLGAYDAAIAVLTSAQALVPADPAFDLYLAQALLGARRFARAAAVADEGLKRAPDQSRLIRVRAQALAQMGRASEAISFLEGAIKAEPRSPQLALALADAYAFDKRYDDAVRVVEQAETAFGENDEFTLRLSSLYEEAGRIGDAERELRAMIARDPLDATALNYLGYLLADRTDRLSEAVELIERALRVEPDNPSYLDSLGWAFYKQGKVAEAADPMARAAAVLPANSVIQDHHGDVLARQGKWTDAVAAWQRALAGDGESIDRDAIDQKIQDAKRRR